MIVSDTSVYIQSFLVFGKISHTKAVVKMIFYRFPIGRLERPGYKNIHENHGFVHVK